MKEFLKHLCILLTILTTVTAEFKDFVIRNENDLERLGLEDEGDYDDDESEYYAEYFSDISHDVDDCAGGYEFSNTILQNDDENLLGKVMKNDKINVEIMRQILKQLQNDPQNLVYMQQEQADSDMYSNMDDCHRRNDRDVFYNLDESNQFYVE